MPYIKQEKREIYKQFGLGGHNPPTRQGGELNYELTLKCLKHVNVNGHNYDTYNTIIGALEACKLEFYRRMVTPYEDKKIIENGDVY